MSRTPASRRPLALVAASMLVVGGATVFAARGLAETPPQPHMREALVALRNAQNHLNQATPDHGGHRAAAIRHVAEAITEVQAGIAYDNSHH